MSERETTLRRQAASYLRDARICRYWARDWERLGDGHPNRSKAHSDRLRALARRRIIAAREIRAFSLGHAVTLPLAR